MNNSLAVLKNIMRDAGETLYFVRDAPRLTRGPESTKVAQVQCKYNAGIMRSAEIIFGNIGTRHNEGCMKLPEATFCWQASREFVFDYAGPAQNA